MKLVALDFDGVISDSAPEAFWVALRTLAELRPEQGTWVRCLEEFGGFDGPLNREVLIEDLLFREFLRLMPLGNRAEDFGVALLSLEAGVPILDQVSYDDYFDAIGIRFAHEFHDRFYRERTALRGRDPERWGSLMSCYPGLTEVLHSCPGSILPVIATAKDRASVRFLLDQYGIGDLFPEDRVFDKEFGRDKSAHLQAIRQRFGQSGPEIVFVDDKVNHLASVESLGVRCVLAAWGYNGQTEQELAVARGFRVCQLDEVEEVLFD